MSLAYIFGNFKGSAHALKHIITALIAACFTQWLSRATHPSAAYSNAVRKQKLASKTCFTASPDVQNSSRQLQPTTNMHAQPLSTPWSQSGEVEGSFVFSRHLNMAALGCVVQESHCVKQAAIRAVMTCLRACAEPLKLPKM